MKTLRRLTCRWLFGAALCAILAGLAPSGAVAAEDYPPTSFLNGRLDNARGERGM
jgi:hypothetical protein